VLVASAVASAGRLVGLLAAGYTVFVMVTGGAAAVPLGIALFGVALGVTFSLVENRLTGRGPFADE
jgi:hypothetical protein